MERPIADERINRRVLVVEDSAIDRHLLRSWLAGEGVEITEASDAAAAQALCLSHPPDLVLLDLSLPDCSGIELLERLKSDTLTSSLPVIVVSGTSSTEEKVRVLEAGAVDFVMKPYDAVELRARVYAALRSKAARDMLEHRAYFDGLTGLANRLALDERLRSEWGQHIRRQTPLSLLMGDIDHFKRINDQHGHAVGDDVLRAVAARVREAVRDTDFAARYGGEEFVVIAPDCDDQGARMIAERMRAAVCDRPIGRGSSAVLVTMSVGLAATDDLFEPTSAAILLDRADAALYDAKAAGRNLVRGWRDRRSSNANRQGGAPVVLAAPRRSSGSS